MKLKNNDSLLHDWLTVDRNIREGRFQRGLALVTSLSGVLAGLEVTYEHYRGSYGQKVMYVPVLVSPVLTAAGIAAFARRQVPGLGPLVATATVAAIGNGAAFRCQSHPHGCKTSAMRPLRTPIIAAPFGRNQTVKREPQAKGAGVSQQV